MYKSVLSDLFGTLIAPPPMDMYRKIVGDVADTLGVTFEILNDPRMSISDRLLTWGGGALRRHDYSKSIARTAD